MQGTERERVKAHVGIAQRKGTKATLTLDEWEQTLADFNRMCAYCQERPFNLIEHFLPVEIAGTHVRNCIPACGTCNRRKRNFTGEKLAELFGQDTVQRIVDYLESRIEGDGSLTPINTSIEYVPRTWKVAPAPLTTPRDPYQWITQIAQEIGKDKATVNRTIDRLGITKHKFPLSRRVFITTKDAHKLKRIFGK